VLSLRRCRQVPALIAVFETASAPMPLQCDTEVVRPHRHAEFPRQVVEDVGRRCPIGMRLDRLQSGIAQRHARRRLLTAARSALRAGCRGSSCRASSPPSFRCIGTAAESRQNAFGDLQFIELISQLCPFGLNPRQPLGNPLLFLPNLVQRRHLVYPSWSPNSEPCTLLHRYSPINGELAHRKKTACKKLLLFNVVATGSPH
jgi:hypothetical protein